MKKRAILQLAKVRNISNICYRCQNGCNIDKTLCANSTLIPIYYNNTGYGGIWSSLSGLVGSKPLDRKDIEPLISKMQDHLMAKNVAADVAKNICDSVTNKLEGKICGKKATNQIVITYHLCTL